MTKNRTQEKKAYRARVKYTFDYISANIYKNQRDSSRDRGHELPAYTLTSSLT